MNRTADIISCCGHSLFGKSILEQAVVVFFAQVERELPRPPWMDGQKGSLRDISFHFPVSGMVVVSSQKDYHITKMRGTASYVNTSETRPFKRRAPRAKSHRWLPLRPAYPRVNRRSGERARRLGTSLSSFDLLMPHRLHRNAAIQMGEGRKSLAITTAVAKLGNSDVLSAQFTRIATRRHITSHHKHARSWVHGDRHHLQLLSTTQEFLLASCTPAAVDTRTAVIVLMAVPVLLAFPFLSFLSFTEVPNMIQVSVKHLPARRRWPRCSIDGRLSTPRLRNVGSILGWTAGDSNNCCTVRY